jgi:PAS domain S-box-containing protein
MNAGERFRLASGYALALALPAAMLAVRLALPVSFGERLLLILFMLPIIVVALAGGLRPGVLATLTSGVITAWYLVPPTGSFAIAAGQDLFQWLMLIVNGALVSLLAGYLHRSRQQVRDALARQKSSQARYAAAMEEDFRLREKTEAELRQREHRLSAIVGHSPSALSLKTPDGRYVLANPNLQRLHGMSEADIVGKTDFDLYPEETARTFRANDERVLRTRARHSIEEVVPVDGRTRTYMSHMFPVPGDDGAVQYICRISLDISERKAADSALSEALEEQARARQAALNLMEDAQAARRRAEAAEVAARQQTEELRQRNEELERFNRASVGRELDMIALKRQINELSARLGEAPPHRLDFLEEAVPPGEDGRP